MLDAPTATSTQHDYIGKMKRDNRPVTCVRVLLKPNDLLHPDPSKVKLPEIKAFKRHLASIPSSSTAIQTDSAESVENTSSVPITTLDTDEILELFNKPPFRESDEIESVLSIYRQFQLKSGAFSEEQKQREAEAQQKDAELDRLRRQVEELMVVNKKLKKANDELYQAAVSEFVKVQRGS
ncbi:hypothetical protein HK102_013957 [Quaeritorhiza haematococci]|nr:hypothetical protein HK102_013957 [Quaeritorhiza haematococci]